MAHCSASYTPCSEPSCHGVAAGEQHRARHLVLRLLYVFAFVLRHVDPRRVTGASVCTSRRTARSSSSSIRRQVFASTHVPPPRDFRALVIYITTAASLSPLFLSLAAGASWARSARCSRRQRRSSSRTASQHSSRTSRWEAHPDFGACARFSS